jgi:hypothetical protein
MLGAISDGDGVSDGFANCETDVPNYPEMIGYSATPTGIEATARGQDTSQPAAIRKQARPTHLRVATPNDADARRVDRSVDRSSAPRVIPSGSRRRR